MKRTRLRESSSETVLRKAREAIAQYRMVEADGKVLVAVSGGADSVALLHVLLNLREELGISLHVAHLNHGIRGKAADKDEEFVRDLAARLQLPCSSERTDVPAIRRERKTSLEETARQVRYEFLNRIAAEVDARRIAVGHTADDKAETFMLNLTRGAGPRGLCALAPVRENIIRPLIHVRHEEILAYLRELGQDFREDETNLSLDHARNRIRLVTLPFLEEHHPGIRDRIADLCEVLSAEQAIFENLITAGFNSVLLTQSEEEIVFSAEGLLHHPLGMRRLILRRAIEKIKGDLRDVGLEQVDRILSRLMESADFGLDLPSGRLSALRRGEEFCLRKRSKPIQHSPFCERLSVPGRVEISGVGVITAEPWDPSDYLRPPHSNDVVIDADKIVGELVVRNRRPGDRMTPLGMTEERKLQDIFTDAKIPVAKRHTVPIVADREKVIWLSGIAMSNIAKVSPDTRRAIHLSFERAPEG